MKGQTNSNTVNQQELLEKLTAIETKIDGLTVLDYTEDIYYCNSLVNDIING